ncbi:MAG: hypothetical protein HY051_04735 [Candidatus Aenigmarchaeota archaeon]|nr:hypothetical protein [Candidatus Aenigmarchaeota archaeon]
MLTNELRNKLREELKNNPKKAIEILKKEPQVIEMLLNATEQVERERNEKIKYVNMTAEMDIQLRDRAYQLKTTQGALIGAGLLFLLLLLED